MEHSQVQRDDKDIIRDVKAGKKAAIDELVRKYQKRVYNMSYGLTMNYDKAWDLSQEVLIKVINNIGSFRGDSSFWTYLYRITANAHYDMCRRDKVRGRVGNFTDMEKEDDDRKFDVADMVNIEEDFDKKVMRESIKDAMEDLTDIQRQVFMLKNIEELKIREISATLGISEGTVKSHLNRAFEKVKAVLGGGKNGKKM